MNLKKMLLLASMALAAIAFAAPAAAHAAPTWSGTHIQGTGQLISDAGGLETGPATVHFTGIVEDDGTTGFITEFEITGPVPTNDPRCHANGTVNEESLPWETHLESPDTLTITDATFINDYTTVPNSPEPCPIAGAEVPVEGDVTLTVTGPTGASAEEYDDSTTLFVEGGGPGVDITGNVSWVGAHVIGLT